MTGAEGWESPLGTPICAVRCSRTADTVSKTPWPNADESALEGMAENEIAKLLEDG